MSRFSFYLEAIFPAIHSTRRAGWWWEQRADQQTISFLSESAGAKATATPFNNNTAFIFQDNK
jgi:hypothetical protein